MAKLQHFYCLQTGVTTVLKYDIDDMENYSLQALGGRDEKLFFQLSSAPYTKIVDLYLRYL